MRVLSLAPTLSPREREQIHSPRTGKRWGALLWALWGVIGCTFHPDLSRFQPCQEGGVCASGLVCWTEEQRCVPFCGEGAHCLADAGNFDAGADAGLEDAGPQPLIFDGQALPPAVEGKTYGFQLQASGGVAPLLFWVADGGLPDGFSLSAQGLISGIGSTEETQAFVVQVEDHSVPPQALTATLTLPVRGLLRVASQAQLTDAVRNTAYSEQLEAVGGISPYSFQITLGELPTGLSFWASGEISGTPLNLGSNTFDLQVTDSDLPPQTAVKSLTVDVVTAPLVLTFLTRSTNDGRLGVLYERQFRAAAGTNPLEYALYTGQLPPGLSLNAADGRLVGTPTQAGTYSFTLQVTDALLGSSKRDFSATIYPR